MRQDVRLYLDMCCLKRSFDDQSNARIHLETLAALAVLQLCRDGQHELLTSETLRFENDQNPNALRRAAAEELLALAKRDCIITPAIESRAVDWQNVSIGPLDAQHLACAESAQAEVFCSCDDRLRQRAKRLSSPLRILGLLELFQELSQ